jgi:ThiS family.
MSMSEVEKVTLRVPSTLSAYSGGKSQIALEAGTVGEMLVALREVHPLLWEKLCTEQGTLREHVRIFVNNQLISDEDEDELQTILEPGQEVIVLPTTFNL